MTHKGILQSIKTNNRLYKKIFESRYNFQLNQHFKKYSRPNILTHLEKKSKIIYYQI